MAFYARNFQIQNVSQNLDFHSEVLKTKLFAKILEDAVASFVHLLLRP